MIERLNEKELQELENSLNSFDSDNGITDILDDITARESQKEEPKFAGYLHLDAETLEIAKKNGIVKEDNSPSNEKLDAEAQKFLSDIRNEVDSKSQKIDNKEKRRVRVNIVRPS